MANDYFNHVNNRVTGLTRALASSVNNIADEIVAAFDKIPSEQEIRADTTNLATNIGTSNAMIASLGYTPSLVDGFKVRIKSPEVNTSAAVTLNLNSTGVKNVRNSDGSELTGAAIAAGTINTYYYDLDNDQWVMESNNSAWGKPDTSPVVNDPNQFCPGLPFTFVSANTWRIEDLDQTGLFRENRRLVFKDGSNTYYGAISAVDYNVTSTGDTTIVMTMEGGDSLTATITDVCLTNNTTQWAEIGSDPFAGTPIRKVTSGNIAGTVYWVAVGDSGKLFTSVDKGNSWTQRTTGTSETIYSVAFDAVNERFMAVGGDGIMLKSTNGTTWTLDTTTIKTEVDLYAGTTPTYEVLDITWGAVEDIFYIVVNFQTITTRDARMMFTSDFGVTWTRRTFNFDYQLPDIVTIDVAPTTDSNEVNIYVGGDLNSEPVVYVGSGDIAPNENILPGAAGGPGYYTVHQFLDAANNYRNVFGNEDGTISWSSGNDSDTAAFSGQITGFASSRTTGIVVAVADNGEIAWTTNVLLTSSTDDIFTFIANPFLFSAKIEGVHYDEDDAMFVAVADNGQICRSSNGFS